MATGPASAADTVVAHVQRPTAIRGHRRASRSSAPSKGPCSREASTTSRSFARTRSSFFPSRRPKHRSRPTLAPTATGGRNSSTCVAPAPPQWAATSSPSRSRVAPASNRSARPTLRGTRSRPTLWNGRIAFARQSQDGTRAVVYTRKLADPPSRRSKRLPGSGSAQGSPASQGIASRVEKLRSWRTLPGPPRANRQLPVHLRGPCRAHLEPQNPAARSRRRRRRRAVPRRHRLRRRISGMGAGWRARRHLPPPLLDRQTVARPVSSRRGLPGHRTRAVHPDRRLHGRLAARAAPTAAAERKRFLLPAFRSSGRAR